MVCHTSIKASKIFFLSSGKTFFPVDLSRNKFRTTGLAFIGLCLITGSPVLQIRKAELLLFLSASLPDFRIHVSASRILLCLRLSRNRPAGYQIRQAGFVPFKFVLSASFPARRIRQPEDRFRCLASLSNNRLAG